MAYLQPTLRAALIANEAVAAIVAGRVHLGGATPDGVVSPYLLLTFAGGVEMVSHDGPPADGLGEDLVEVAAVAADYETAAKLHAAADAVLLAGAGLTEITRVTPEGRPYDAPNLDAAITLYAVVRLYRVANR